MAASTAVKKLLVIGATGSQGTGVIRDCIVAGYDVSAFVRNPDSPSAKHLSQQYRLPLLKGDLDDPDSLRRALVGIDALFFFIMPVGAEAELRQTKNVVEAAKASGSVSTVIFSSAAWTGQHESFPGWGPRHPMYEYWVTKHETEVLVREAGFERWTIVRPAFFLQNFLPPSSDYLFPGLARDHTLRVGFKPDAKIDVIDASNVGHVAALALSRPDKYSGREIDLAAESLTIREIADRIAMASKVSVNVEYVDADTLAAEIGELFVAHQRLFNEIGNYIDTARAKRKFGLTSTADFFLRNPVDFIKQAAP
ncbi:hypothetical protein AAE478_003591 [Parahypoxylon ruwenzoriense]